MGTFKESYQELEQGVKNALWDRVVESEVEADNFNSSCIKIDEGDYKEIAIIDDRLILIDRDDNFSDIGVLSLDELINILDKY